ALSSGTLRTTGSTPLVAVTGTTGNPALTVARILNATGGTLTLAGPLLSIAVNTSVTSAVLKTTASLTPGASTLVNVTAGQLTAAKLLDLSGTGTVLDLGSGSLATIAGAILESGAGPTILFADNARLATTGDLFTFSSGTPRTTGTTTLVDVSRPTRPPAPS